MLGRSAAWVTAAVVAPVRSDAVPRGGHAPVPLPTPATPPREARSPQSSHQRVTPSAWLKRPTRCRPASRERASTRAAGPPARSTSTSSAAAASPPAGGATRGGGAGAGSCTACERAAAGAAHVRRPKRQHGTNQHALAPARTLYAQKRGHVLGRPRQLRRHGHALAAVWGRVSGVSGADRGPRVEGPSQASAIAPGRSATAARSS